MSDDPESHRTTILVDPLESRDGFENLEDGMNRLASAYNLEVAPVKAFRRAAGAWPLISLTGTKVQVREALLRHWDVSAEELVRFYPHLG